MSNLQWLRAPQLTLLLIHTYKVPYGLGCGMLHVLQDITIHRAGEGNWRTAKFDVPKTFICSWLTHDQMLSVQLRLTSVDTSSKAD